MLLTILGAFAQSERESIAHNVIWSTRQAMREGKVTMIYPLPDGTRTFMPRYHIQAERATPAYALTVIAEYTYEGHKAAMRRWEQGQLRKYSAQETPILQKEPLVKKSNAPGIWEKVRLVLEEIKIWLRRTFQK